MSNKERLYAFLKAENDRNWTDYAEALHTDVLWELHGKQIQIIRGKDNYLNKIIAIYEDDNIRFHCYSMVVSKDENRIVTLLVNDRGEKSLDIFEFEKGLITKEYEFLLG